MVIDHLLTGMILQVTQIAQSVFFIGQDAKMAFTKLGVKFVNPVGLGPKKSNPNRTHVSKPEYRS